MEDRLRECPFCGAEPTLVSDFKPGRKGCQTAMVRCDKCHSDGYIADSCLNETERAAIDRWNIRATDPLMEEMARALKDAIDLSGNGCIVDDERIDLWEALVQKYREAAC